MSVKLVGVPPEPLILNPNDTEPPGAILPFHPEPFAETDVPFEVQSQFHELVTFSSPVKVQLSVHPLTSVELLFLIVTLTVPPEPQEFCE